MAQNKNAQIRYKALDTCFSNAYKLFYIDDLIEFCSEVLTAHYIKDTTVSRRQIFIDIDFMKSEAGFNAPIENYKKGRKVHYQYSDPEFSILKSPLNPSELSSLNEALETLSRINNLPGFDWVNTMQAKLNSGIHQSQSQRQIISFEDNEFLKGIELLNPLYHHIANSQVIDVIYRGFASDKESTFCISPYYLKQYNNRWFLFGYNHEFEKIQNLALDRIVKIQVTKLKFKNCEIDFKEYFEDIIGVSNDELKEAVNIKIELSQNIIPYISSKPLHGSQKIKDNILHLQVKLNYELEALILSYGENMCVLEPPELAHKIKERIAKIKSIY
ncbi:helix-turn-helix transcriptional regulator [Chryseobacterium balustinum]|uniref:Predicted DNA-binding transcriptional regulator YafY, contains an HTH and WYL domains n=1 Tax=Chryseobacterium balustinum TaxID=246 RepID=A0ABY1LBD0_9FLAO|nr:WYL domain-containing protein [Chryseobacterium balustinum]AZB32152.1 WYL domain-containing protein [Chryseobacterium balustinum]SKB93715.1 Predicted DNA-binding transcriptional regulator YafY, contains an HTH and WYL domains [Chryseobacterium balustinum]